ncbi:MAG TPA: cytochrome P450 [Steroidobacteraceae bacterium]|nr:cytochrome P450 [Steroidobacteraceae bacterium]
MTTTSPVTIDPYDHRFHWDPYPYYRAAREHDPVYYYAPGGFWLLTKWDDVQRAFRDHKTFINSGAVALERDANEKLPYPLFIGSDPPEHTRQRAVLAPLLMPASLAPLESFIRARTRALLTPHLPRGQLDLVADLACYLPMDVLALLLSIPAEDRDRVRSWADDLMAREDRQTDLAERNVGGYMNLAQYFEAHTARLAGQPGAHGLVAAMLAAQEQGQMSHTEVVGNLILLAIAGNETTTKLIGNMAYRLWEHPEQRRWLIEDPALLAKAIEETLRFDGSSQILVRRVGQEVTLRGKLLKKGDRVGLCVVSANRDADKFENAELFDIRRGSREHLAFGYGVHACIGAALARLETRVVFEELLRLLPEYEIEAAGLRRAHNPNVRGFTHVPVRFAPASA